MKSYPLISIIVPTLNEEKNIKQCLESIFRQNYPKKRLEVIVVDDKSTDSTVEIAKQFPVKILVSGAKHGEISKMIGFKVARGEFAIYLDADIELMGTDWFQKMVKPLKEDKEIIGSFTRKYTKKSDPSIERFLTFDPLQRDSLYQFFSRPIESVIAQKRDGYFVCKYSLGKIPPAGRCLYRRKEVLKLVSNYDMFLELDFLVLLVEAGFTKFAYVLDAGLYHHHAKDLSHLLTKRRYNLKKVYLARTRRLYKWFDLSSPIGIFKLIAWVIYANLIIPSIVVGIYKSLKYRDLAGMYEPIVNILVTDVLLLESIRDSRSWKLLLNKDEQI